MAFLTSLGPPHFILERCRIESNRATVLRTLDTQLEPKHTALLIVDVQNDFVHPDGVCPTTIDYHYGSEARENLWKEGCLLPRAIGNLPKLIDSARKAGCLVVFIQAIYDAVYISDAYAARLDKRGIFGKICQAGTFGADFFGDIRPYPGPREVIVTKHRFSAFWGTDLDLILSSNGIKTVVASGVATSVCVESAVRDAFFNDYNVVVAEDACADYVQASHDAALAAMSRSFGEVVSSETIIKKWVGE